MKHLFLTISLLVFSVGVSAEGYGGQNANSKSGSFAGAGASSGAAAVVNQHGAEGLRYSGEYDLNNVPTVYAPSFSSMHPCLVGFSGGGAVAGFGMSIGFARTDVNCERLQKAARISEMGRNDAAIELLCDDLATYKAMGRTGKPCMTNAAFDSIDDEAMAFEDMPDNYKKAYQATQPGDSFVLMEDGKL